MITIGIDPDSDKHGVAIYDNGKLIALEMMNDIEIATKIVAPLLKDNIKCLFSIEDVNSQDFIYNRNVKASVKATIEVARALGKCQQAQVSLQRMLDHHKIPYVNFTPQSGNWKDLKRQFELVTGWKGRSNGDTRSAAFFGFLALRSKVK